MLPILYQSPELIIYSYPLLMGIGWGIAYQVFFFLTQLPKPKAHLLFWGIFLSSWFGAKFLYILLTPGRESLISSPSFWTGGGFVFYGGLLAGFLFLGLVKIFHKQLVLSDLWAFLPALCFGHAIGRIGCLLAGCCFGKPTDLIWGVWLHDHYRHPTQLIEASSLIILGLFLLKSSRPRKFLVSTYLITYGILRFLVEHLRGDDIRGEWAELSTSQWISLFLFALGVSLKISHLTSKNRKSQV